MVELAERIGEYTGKKERRTLSRVFGTSANERLGGWSIIRANIQDARQPS